MSEPKYNLLTEPWISVEDGGGVRSRATLPGVLAGLGSGAPMEFPALRSHQRHPWHAFVVQLAALACVRSGDEDLAVDEARWRERLLGLTEGAHEPYCLVVEALASPALLQPPVPEGKLDGFKRRFDQPDALDVLITAKNHDIKGARMDHSRPEHWLFALVALQTTEGFLGKGNYGVARMNGGFASRPQVAVARGPGFGERFARDVRTWLEARSGVLATFPYDPKGIGLVWCEPWDGATSLPLQRLDPFFIEVCRRVRLTSAHDRIEARGASTEGARIDAKLLLGVTGDIWIPVKRDDAGKALTVSANGFNYVLLSQLLTDGSFQPAAAQTLRTEDGDAPVLLARVLARGQGETNGLHERVIEIPAEARDFFAQPSQQQRFGALARRRVDQVAEVRKRALRPALCVLLQAGPDKPQFDDDRINPFVARFEERVDEAFFPSLWRDAAADDTAADASWLSAVLALGRTVLNDAIRTVPLPSERRFRAEAMALRIFEGSARNNFAVAFPARETASPTKEQAR